MWEAVTDEAKFALLDILLDRVEGLLFGDLMKAGWLAVMSERYTGRTARVRRRQCFPMCYVGGTDLHLRIGPAGNLDNHVEDGLLLIGIQGDIVEWGNGDAILLNKDAMLEGVGSANLAGGILGSHGGVL